MERGSGTKPGRLVPAIDLVADGDSREEGLVRRVIGLS